MLTLNVFVEEILIIIICIIAYYYTKNNKLLVATLTLAIFILYFNRSHTGQDFYIKPYKKACFLIWFYKEIGTFYY